MYLSEPVGLFCGTFSHAGWVAESEYDWLLVEFSHQLNKSLGERARDCCSTDSHGRLEISHDVLQIGHVFVFLGKYCLVRSHSTARTILQTDTDGITLP